MSDYRDRQKGAVMEGLNAKQLQALRRIANRAPRSALNGLTLAALRRRRLIYRRLIDGPGGVQERNHLTSRGRRILDSLVNKAREDALRGAAKGGQNGEG